MAEQLVFDLPVKTAFGRDDFFTSPANLAAVAAIEDWENWPRGKLVLTGPKGAGKSHLARIWAELAGAKIVSAEHVGAEEIQNLSSGPVCVEDVCTRIGALGFEQDMFHLHNALAEAGHPFLMTGHSAPSNWAFVLPDLASRVQGSLLVQLGAPDDTLLAAVFLKLCADRQLQMEPGVVDYVLRRLERSFEAVHGLVADLDRVSLQRKRPIGQRLASETLKRIEETL